MYSTFSIIVARMRANLIKILDSVSREILKSLLKILFLIIEIV